MKVNFFIFLFLIFNFLSLKGQVDIGINIGASLFEEIETSSRVGSDLYPEKFKMGCFLSIPVRFKLKKSIFLQTELNYIQKGSQWDSDRNVSSGEYIDENNKITYHFIEIPVLAQYEFQLKKKSTLGIGTGVGIGRSVGKLKYKVTNIDTGESVVIRKSYRIVSTGASGQLEEVKYLGIDLDVIFDVQYSYKIRDNFKLVLGSRGQYDFINMYAPTQAQLEASQISNYGIKNLGFAFYAGVSIELRKKSSVRKN